MSPLLVHQSSHGWLAAPREPLPEPEQARLRAMREAELGEAAKTRCSVSRTQQSITQRRADVLRWVAAHPWRINADIAAGVGGDHKLAARALSWLLSEGYARKRKSFMRMPISGRTRLREGVQWDATAAGVRWLESLEGEA